MTKIIKLGACLNGDCYDHVAEPINSMLYVDEVVANHISTFSFHYINKTMIKFLFNALYGSLCECLHDSLWIDDE